MGIEIGGIVIATGTHPAPNKEKIEILTEGYDAKLNCPLFTFVEKGGIFSKPFSHRTPTSVLPK